MNKINELKELTETHEKLLLQYEEVDKCAKELAIANNELISQMHEKHKRATELEKMIFMTSHKVRQPVVHILGLSGVLDDLIDSPDKLREIVGYIKESALLLDVVTKELTSYMSTID